MAIITLAPKGSFHIGEPVGIEQQRVLAYIPADTLFAAFVTAWAERGQIAAHLPQFLNDTPPLLLTSAFPCLYKQDPGCRPHAALRFFPRPLVKINADERAKDQVGKRLKQAAWVSETLFWRLCRGNDVSDACNDTCFGPGGMWITPQEIPADPTQRRRGAKDEPPRLRVDSEGHLEALWEQWDVPRVALDRRTNAGTLYHAGCITLHENVGFWFALRGDVSVIHSALDVLADSGLGGLRSTGHGAFAWGWDDMFSSSLEREDCGESDYVVTLSRYAPRGADEIETALRAPRTAYRLESIAGWCVDDYQHAWRRRKVRLVAEGSVLGAGAGGQLVDVTPNKPKEWQDDATPWPFSTTRRVYRWGYAFPIKIAAAALPEEVYRA